MSELKEALRDTKRKLKQVGDDVRSMVNTLRPEEPLLAKTRKIFGNPVRKRLRRRLDRHRIKKEE